MKLVIGGAFQGKSTLAEKDHPDVTFSGKA